ncbi:biogenesis of lysosome- organelles complex 1 subunit 2 [Thoreauomyces humboldtii]|nr:biogenesis of lysosome- organelles complex 1 subunit 2 [Thoreauomyces humboldtii]
MDSLQVPDGGIPPPLPARRPSEDSQNVQGQQRYSTRKASLSPRSTAHIRDIKAAEEDVDEAMQKVMEHFKHEIMVAAEEFVVLHTMTGLARDAYSDFNDTSQELIAGMGKVQLTYSEMDTHLNQIFDLERQVSSMEQVIFELDEYTKQLEQNVKRSR